MVVLYITQKFTIKVRAAVNHSFLMDVQFQGSPRDLLGPTASVLDCQVSVSCRDYSCFVCCYCLVYLHICITCESMKKSCLKILKDTPRGMQAGHSRFLVPTQFERLLGKAGHVMSSFLTPLSKFNPNITLTF